MAIPLALLLACELELTAVAAAIGWRFLNPRSALLTGGLSAAFVLAVFALWLLWFVAPGCVVNSECAVANSAYLDLGAGAIVQWTWMLAIAQGAKFTKNRNSAHASG